tara:strand:- start:1148 stop:1336 length:189 start_codon:yes stop_codon:yes gene_type:complete
MVIWYLIERACFSLISAFSRSPPLGSMLRMRLPGSGRSAAVRPDASLSRWKRASVTTVMISS